MSFIEKVPVIKTVASIVKKGITLTIRFLDYIVETITGDNDGEGDYEGEL